MESKGRIGRETGKEGIRRGKVVVVGEDEEGVSRAEGQDDIPTEPRKTELDDWTLRVGMLEKIGSGYDATSESGLCGVVEESLESDST